MIKLMGTRGGKKLLGLGVSLANIERLMRGDPILVNEGEMDPTLGDLEITIFYGATEAALEKMLRDSGMVDEHTKVNIDPKLR
jgi:hypothetical protein